MKGSAGCHMWLRTLCVLPLSMVQPACQSALPSWEQVRKSVEHVIAIFKKEPLGGKDAVVQPPPPPAVPQPAYDQGHVQPPQGWGPPAAHMQPMVRTSPCSCCSLHRGSSLMQACFVQVWGQSRQCCTWAKVIDSHRLLLTDDQLGQDA